MSSFPLGPAQRNPFDAEPARVIRDRLEYDPFSRVYFLPTGGQTVIEPSVSFRDQLRARLSQSAAETSPEFLGTLGTGALRSGADWVAAHSLETMKDRVKLPGPFDDNTTNGWQVITPSGPRPAAEVTMTDLWGSFNSLERRAMEQAGYSAAGFSAIGISNAEQFADRWPTILQSILGRQTLERAKQETPVTSWAAAATNLVLQLGTDPMMLISAGASGAVKSRAKRAVIKAAATGSAEDAARAIAKITGKDYSSAILQTIAEGPTHRLAQRAIAEGRTGTARSIFQGGATSYGATAGAAMGYAAQTHALQVGSQDPSQDLQTPYLAAATGGLVGMGFSYLGLKAIGHNTGVITHAKYLSDNPVYNLGSEISSRLSARNPKSLETALDMEQFKAADAIEDLVAVMYTPQQVRELKEVSELIGNAKIEDSDVTRSLRDYMLTFPTHEELTNALRKGDFSEDTRFAVARRNLWELSQKVRDAVVKGDVKGAKSLRRSLTFAQQEYDDLLRNHFRLNDTGLETKPEGLVEALRSLANDVPLSTIPNHNVRITELQKRLSTDLVSENYYTTSLIPWLQNSKLGRISGWFSPAMRLKAGMAADDADTVLISRMLSLIDKHALGEHEKLRFADGRSIEDANTKVELHEIRNMNPIMQLTDALSYKKDHDTVVQDFKDIMRSLGGLEDSSPEAAQLVKKLRSTLDEFADRGVQAGTIESKLDDFVPVYMKDEVSLEQEAIWGVVWREEMMAVHGRDAGLSADVHFNTLARLGYVDKAGAVHTLNERTPIDFSSRIDAETGEMLVPTKVSEINEKYREDYYNGLDDTIRLEAEWSLNRRISRGINFDPDGRDPELDLPFVGETQNARAVRNFVRSDKSRRIEQRILLDERILNSGMVELDPVKYMEWYSRSTGYNIMRDEAVGELFGEPVRWPDLMEALGRMAKSDKAKQALETLQYIDKTQAGRLRLRPEGAVFSYNLSNLASATVNLSVAPTIAGTEGTLTLARTITHQSFYANLIGNMKDVLKSAIDSGHAKSLGFERAMEHSQSRVFTEFNDHLPKVVRDSKTAAFTKTYSEAARIIGLERPLTNGLKQANFNLSYDKMWTYRKRFDKWLTMDLQRVIADRKEAAGVARVAGIPFGEYRMLKDYGLLDPDMIRIAKKINDIDGLALSHRRRMRDMILQLDGVDQKAARELDARLSKMSLDDTQKIIATPSASTRAVASAWGEQPLFRLLAGFTSWTMAFQTATLSRIGNTAYSKQAAFLGLFIAGEIFNQMYRDTVYGGYSLDEAAAKWTEDGDRNLAIVLTRMPIWGAFNPFAGMFQMTAAGYGSGASSAFDSPALGFLDRSLNAAMGAGKKLATGEDITDAQARAMWRISPVGGQWWARSAYRGMQGFESTR